VSPIKRPCQEKTLIHGKNIIFFLGHTRHSRQVFVLPFSSALIFNCFRVAALFDPRQSPVPVSFPCQCHFQHRNKKGAGQLIDLKIDAGKNPEFE